MRAPRLYRVTRTANPNYLFIDLLIAPGAAPGRLDIAFRKGGKTVLHQPYELLARAAGSAERKGFSSADAIYLAMPDRFANGDPANDRVAGYREAADRTNPDGRHGGDLEGLRARLGYIADMGFTQLWLTPVQQNDQPRGSYHGYAITDFYRVDDRFGDNAGYARLVSEARSRGLGVIMDVILNHCGSEHWWMKDLPDPDWINHGGTFAGTTHRRETLWDPHAARADEAAFTDGWFVPTMPDLNQRHPLVATYLIQNAIWWAETAGVSGFRVDTLPYSDRGFLSQWRDRLLEEYPGLSIVGEEWSVDPAIVSRWQQGPPPGPEPAPAPLSLMDFPLQHALVQGLTEPEGRETGLIRIYQALADDFLYADPNRLVVFGDNHDTSRIHTQLGADAARTKMAFAFIATVRGIPRVHVWLRDPDAESGAQGGWPCAAGFPRRLGRRFRRRHERPGPFRRGARRAGLSPPPPRVAAQRERGHGRHAHAVRAGERRVRVFPPRRAPARDDRLQQDGCGAPPRPGALRRDDRRQYDGARRADGPQPYDLRRASSCHPRARRSSNSRARRPCRRA